MYWRDVDDPQAFSQYMEKVDARLKSDGVDIPSRPLHAFGIVSAELKVKFALSSAIAQRINGWFQQRYGARLNIDWSIGAMLVEVRGDAFAVRYPLVFGTVKVNPLALIQDATPTLCAGLGDEEIKHLAGIIMGGFEALLRVQAFPQPPLRDLASAVSHMVARPADPGLSKWSSQQAVEKMLNSIVTAAGRDPRERGKGSGGLHDLLPLVELAEAAGLAKLDRELIARAECSAAARYGRLTIAPSDAVMANQASVTLCGVVAGWWDQRRRDR